VNLLCTIAVQESAVVDESTLAYEKVVDMTVVSFGYFKEESRYFIEVTGDKSSQVNGATGSASVCFMTKNQADITLKSSEQDYINWQRMLAASLNVRYLPCSACLNSTLGIFTAVNSVTQPMTTTPTNPHTFPHTHTPTNLSHLNPSARAHTHTQIRRFSPSHAFSHNCVVTGSRPGAKALPAQGRDPPKGHVGAVGQREFWAGVQS
jgi:hypothetical protein